MKYNIEHTRKIDSYLIDCIKADSERYFDVSKLTEKIL